MHAVVAGVGRAIGHLSLLLVRLWLLVRLGWPQSQKVLRRRMTMTRTGLLRPYWVQLVGGWSLVVRLGDCQQKRRSQILSLPLRGGVESQEPAVALGSLV